MQLAQLGQDVTQTADSGGAVGTTTFFGGPDTSSSGTDSSTMNTASTDAVSTATDAFGNIDVSKLVDSLSKAYVSVATAVTAGQIAHTTATYPTPGTVQQLPGGVTRVVNPDGSTTITDAQGNKQTITRSGQVVSGGAPFIDGIPNTTLLLAGIALLGIFVRLVK